MENASKLTNDPVCAREEINHEIRRNLETLGQHMRDAEGARCTDEDSKIWLGQYAGLVRRQAQLLAVSHPLEQQGK